MDKEKVTFEQLIAGLLLKFGKVDGYDIALLIEGIKKECSDAIVELDYDSTNYFVMADGTIVLDQEYVNKVYKTLNNTLLERMQGNVVKNYLDNIEVGEFVLRKIKLMGPGCVVVDDLSSNFSIAQMHAMVKLYVDDYIIDYVHRDVIYGDYQAVKLTQKGEVNWFLSTYSKEISEFVRDLRQFRYNGELVGDYLMSQNLRKSVEDVLSINDFLWYCSRAGKSPYIEGMDPYARKRVHTTN